MRAEEWPFDGGGGQTNMWPAERVCTAPSGPAVASAWRGNTAMGPQKKKNVRLATAGGTVDRGVHTLKNALTCRQSVAVAQCFTSAARTWRAGPRGHHHHDSPKPCCCASRQPPLSLSPPPSQGTQLPRCFSRNLGGGDARLFSSVALLSRDGPRGVRLPPYYISRRLRPPDQHTAT